MSLYDIIAGIVLLGILVFIHELGHFMVAKAAKVKVLKFSLGFGRSLISRQWGETEYMISAIPLGGYVKMLGETEQVEGEETPLSPEDQNRSYANKSPLWRIAIIAAGPLMNLLLPFILLPVSYMVGINLPAFLDEPACVGFVHPGTAGESAGFQSGDCIIEIGNNRVATWVDTNMQMIEQAGSELHFKLLRNGTVQSLSLPAEINALEGLRSIGLEPAQAAVIGGLSPGMPAKAAGIKVGDRIISINGAVIESWYDLRPRIQESSGAEMQVGVERDGVEMAFELLPAQIKGVEGYLIGIGPYQAVVEKKYGFVEAVKAGAEKTFELIDLTLLFLQKLVTGQVSMTNVGGPIMIVQVAGQAAQIGLSAIFTLLAFLSIQLGILNLFPIPILDGGHLVFNFYELVFRRPMSIKIREIAQQIGLVLLVMLMIVVFYNDISRQFFGG